MTDRFKLINFEDVKDTTTNKYFSKEKFAVDMFDAKYSHIKEDGKKETPAEVFLRIAYELSRFEKSKDEQKHYCEMWFSLLWTGWFRPGGSIMHGVGSSSKVSLNNCTTIPLGGDSLEEINKCDYNVMKCAAFRQGIGVDVSELRPCGAEVNNAANKSTGIVPWVCKIVDNGKYVGQCLHGDAQLLTVSGDYIKIKDVVGGKQSINIEGENGQTEVIDWFINSKKALFEIITEYGDKLVSSKEHEYKVVGRNGVYKKALQDIDITNEFLVCRRVDIDKPYEVIPKFIYNKSSYNNSNKLFEPKTLPEYFNEDLAYLCGNIYGDGSEYKGCIELALADDLPEVTDKIDVILKTLFGEGIGNYGFNIRKGDGAVKRLSINKFVTSFLGSIGVVKQKGGNMVLPEILKRSPKTVVLSFFAGLFDADGYNSMSKKNIDLSLIDYDFLYNLKLQLFRCGIISKVTNRRKKPHGKNNKMNYKLSIIGKRSMKDIATCGSIKLNRGNLYGKYDHLKTPYMLKDIDIENKSKLKEVGYLQYITDEIYENLTSKISDYYIQKIKKVKDFGEDVTYDITVDNNTHLFLANNIIVSNSGRMPALLISLKVDHPDVEEFITAKMKQGVIENANISVQITNVFMKAVENDEDWELHFDFSGDSKYETIIKTVKAKEIFSLIAKTAHASAEPGVQYIDLMKKGSMVQCVANVTGDKKYEIISTNACSEKPLPAFGVCNLLSINMEMFSTNADEYKKEIEFIAPYLVRLSDNVVTYELSNKLSPVPEQRDMVEFLREIGMGATNIHGWFLKQDLAYDSDKATKIAEDFFKHYAYNVFKTSVALGKEKGNSPAFDMVENKKEFMDSIYFNNIVTEFFDGDANKIKNMRNMAHMSIAPTGSLSNSFPAPCISSGIEPVIGLYYWRKTRAIENGVYVHYFVIPNILKKYILSKIDKGSEDYLTLMKFSGSERDEDGVVGKELIEIINKYIPAGFFKFAHEIDYKKKINLMASVYKWVDAAISCTYNLPSTSTPEDVEAIYIEAYKKGVRAVSVYVDGSREGVLIFNDPITNRSKFERKKNICSKRPESIQINCAPKRHDVLECNIHQISIKGETWTVLVGMLYDLPFEIFCGQTEELYIPKSCKKGKIIKRGHSKYSLEIMIRRSPVEYKDLAQVLMSDNERALTRLLSLNLRHGIPLQFIVSQLKKSNGGITTFSTAISRVLSSYIDQVDYMYKDTEKKCPGCGKSTMVFKGGCFECVECGYSKCG